MQTQHEFYTPLSASRATKQRAGSALPESTDKELSLRLDGLPDDRLITITHRQLAALSTVSIGSMSFRLATDGLAPAVPRSNVYRVGDVREFCEQNMARTVERLEQGARALGKNPKETPK